MSHRTRSIRSATLVFAAIAGFGLTACDDDTVNTVPPVASVITVDAASKDQTGTVGAALAVPIKVRTTTAGGAIVPGTTVTWTVATGGGSVSAATSVADASGDATTNWTLGPDVGANTLTASIPGSITATISATGAVATP
jgi:plastocyanin